MRAPTKLDQETSGDHLSFLNMTMSSSGESFAAAPHLPASHTVPSTRRYARVHLTRFSLQETSPTITGADESASSSCSHSTSPSLVSTTYLHHATYLHRNSRPLPLGREELHVLSTSSRMATGSEPRDNHRTLLSTVIASRHSHSSDFSGEKRTKTDLMPSKEVDLLSLQTVQNLCLKFLIRQNSLTVEITPSNRSKITTALWPDPFTTIRPTSPQPKPPIVSFLSGPHRTISEPPTGKRKRPHPLITGQAPVVVLASAGAENHREIRSVLGTSFWIGPENSGL